MKSDSGKFSSTLHSFHLKLVFVLKSHLNFTKEAFASQWSHSSPGALLVQSRNSQGGNGFPGSKGKDVEFLGSKYEEGISLTFIAGK